jgi:hypothetical protein
MSIQSLPQKYENTAINGSVRHFCQMAENDGMPSPSRLSGLQQILAAENGGPSYTKRICLPRMSCILPRMSCTSFRPLTANDVTVSTLLVLPLRKKGREINEVAD